MILHFTRANLLLICFIIFTVVFASGQNNADYPHSTIPLSSPTSSSLGKYADIPVSYHTGIPTVEIDLYTIEEGPLKVPVNLSYHAGGLKVQEQAGWVGAGWSLNINGVVTRGSIRGLADETLSNAGGDGMPGGYLYRHGYYAYLYESGAGLDGQILDYLHFGRGEKDGEPDLFFYNFNGYSGKFYFREDGTPVLIPQQDIRIQPLFTDGFQVDRLYGWIITTPDGVKYTFGKTPAIAGDTDAVDHTHPYSYSEGQTISKEVSSWYLTRIESADGKFFIQYNYTPEEYGYYSISMFPITIPFVGSRGFTVVKNRVFGVRLASVTFSNGSVQLVPMDTPREDLSNSLVPYDGENAEAKALKAIRIEGPDFCKTFDFTYSYFESNEPLHGDYNVSGGVGWLNLHTDKKRLALRSVKENLCNNEASNYNYALSKPPYIFSYYDEAAVPRALSLGIDHWGFNNGAVANIELIPSVSVNGGFFMNEGYGANRESAWPAMRAGALQSIRYPTGKKSEIVYGSHKVFVNHSSYTETMVYDKSATGSTPQSATSEKIDYSLPMGGVVKLRAKGFGGGSGVMHFGSFIWGSGTTTEWSENVFVVPPGTYQMYCDVSGQLPFGQGVQGQAFVLERQQQLESVVVGGLRAESITTTDGIGSAPLTTSFSYVSDGNIPQGVLYGRPSYVMILKNDRMRESGIAWSGSNDNNGITAVFSNGCQNVGGSDVKYAYELSPASVMPMQTTQGSHFGYNQVKVVGPGGGYTLYQYSTGQNLSTADVSGKIINESVCDPFAPNYPPAPEPIEYKRGELQRIIVFDDQDRKLKETQLENIYTTEAVGIHGLIVKGGNAGSYLFATEYELKNQKKVQSSTLEFDYSQANANQRIGILTETFFKSPGHNLPTLTVTTEVIGGDDLLSFRTVTRGRILNENRRRYVGDVTLPSCVPSTAYVATLLSELATLKSNYVTDLTYCAQDATCRLYAWWRYVYGVNERRKTYATNLVNSHTPSTGCLQANPLVDLRTLLDLKVQNNIALVVESSHWKDDKFAGSTFVTYKNYGTNNGSNMIYPEKAETYRTGKLLPGSSFQAFTFTNLGITKDTHYRQEESYKYQDGNLVEVTRKDGVPTAYLWGYNNTLPIAKATGVPFSVLLAANTAANGDPSALRSQASLAKALLTTYQFNPLAGMTMQTDPNGVVTKYAYDGLGRLSFMRDSHDNVVQKIDYLYRNRP